MISIFQLGRLLKIQRTIIKYGLEDLALRGSRFQWLLVFTFLSPTRWLNRDNREKPRAQRIRLALEELGPVFVKLGQILSTRQDLLPSDIGQELTRLQDRVPPFSNSIAREEVSKALGQNLEQVFASFDEQPMAAASIAQVYGARFADGGEVVVKVVRPGIEKIIDRDVSLMYLMAGFFERVWDDAERIKAREVVAEYDATIHDELDLLREAANAVTLKNNFAESDLLYIPEVYWELSRVNVLVMERIEGIPIRDIETMHALNLDMERLAINAVEIFYTQVFKHNFFHADMHPGNIFVSAQTPSNPTFIAVDFGIVGSLTEEDQHYLGENMLAFFRRDYRRVAQLHVDSGWVPADTRVAELENAIRSVCDPIFEKPLAEISFGLVLVQLFQTARRFNMEVQPQLVLLQKTLLNIEGLGRQLHPELDLWKTAKPFLERWVIERRGPKAIASKFVQNMPYIVERLPELPLLVDRMLSTTRLQRNPPPPAQKHESKATRYVIIGCTFFLSSSILGAAVILVTARTSIPVYVWLLGGLGIVLAIKGLLSRE